MYTKQKLLTKVSHYVSCPSCRVGDINIDTENKKELYIDPVYCESCNAGFFINLKDKTVELESCDVNKYTALVFLKYENLLLIARDRVYPEDLDYQEKYYNMQLCPELYFREVVGVVDLTDKDADPHGMFEYITTVIIGDNNVKFFQKDQFSIDDFERLTGLTFEELSTNKKAR